MFRVASSSTLPVSATAWGGAVSRRAASAAGADWLPAGSVSVAVTVSRVPSAGRATVVVQAWAAMSAAVSTCVCGVVPSVTASTSPTLASGCRPSFTATVVALPISAVYSRPSLLASVVMVTVGALGAVVSSLAESEPGAETLPAASVSVAVTVRVPPSAGLAKVVV